jgi:hypothetical protein
MEEEEFRKLKQGNIVKNVGGVKYVINDITPDGMFIGVKTVIIATPDLWEKI